MQLAYCQMYLETGIKIIQSSTANDDCNGSKVSKVGKDLDGNRYVGEASEII